MVVNLAKTAIAAGTIIVVIAAFGAVPDTQASIEDPPASRKADRLLSVWSVMFVPQISPGAMFVMRAPQAMPSGAKDYLIETAHPGGTMRRQGVRLSIERLHPVFAERLSVAVRRAREAGLSDVGPFSCYRPPGYGVGGFSDKFQSLHSYGLACDMWGIGDPGSRESHLWARVATAAGLHGYGPNARSEWNHWQLMPWRGIGGRWELRDTITASGPIETEKMWKVASTWVDRGADNQPRRHRGRPGKRRH